jgi:hypothetical protein
MLVATGTSRLDTLHVQAVPHQYILQATSVIPKTTVKKEKRKTGGDVALLMRVEGDR